VAGQSLTPALSVVFTTTGGTGNYDTVTFSTDGDYVDFAADPSNTDRLTVLVDPGSTNPVRDADGTITIFPGGTLLEPSKVRGSTVVKVISSAPGQRLALRVVNG